MSQVALFFCSTLGYKQFDNPFDVKTIHSEQELLEHKRYLTFPNAQKAQFLDQIYVGPDNNPVFPLSFPTSLAFCPDGRKFVTEKAGKVRVIDANGNNFVQLTLQRQSSRRTLARSHGQGILGRGQRINEPYLSPQFSCEQVILERKIICSDMSSLPTRKCQPMEILTKTQ